MTTSPGQMDENMDKMQTSITDLQGELNVVNKPIKNHFKPGWLLAATIVVLIIGLGTFLLASRVIRVDTNTEEIDKACQVRNEQIKVVNSKFEQLVVLLDASMAHRPPDQPPPAAEVLKLYGEFRKPISLLECTR